MATTLLKDNLKGLSHSNVITLGTAEEYKCILSYLIVPPSNVENKHVKPFCDVILIALNKRSY